MISSTFKRSFITFEGFWFCKDPEQLKSKADILLIHNLKSKNYTPNKTYFYEDQYSLISDLAISEDELMKVCNKNCRYEIRRAQKENSEITYYLSKDIQEKPQILSDFKNEYNKFIKTKGIASAYNEEAVQQYLEKGNFILSYANFEDTGWLWHGYIADENNTRLLYSASNIKMEKVDRSFAGRVNRLLHWKDMLYFKNSNVKFYDWGGVGDFKTESGISKFKKGFGGVHDKTYTLFVANTLKGKIAIKLLRAFKKI